MFVKQQTNGREPNSAKQNLKKIMLTQMISMNKGTRGIDQNKSFDHRSNGRASANTTYKLIDIPLGSGVSHSNDNSISYPPNNAFIHCEPNKQESK